MAEEVLAARIVITVGFAGMRDGDPSFIQISDVLDIGILESLIGMKDTLMRRIPFIIYCLIYIAITSFRSLNGEIS